MDEEDEQPRELDDILRIEDNDFTERFGESIDSIMNIESWKSKDESETLRRLHEEVSQAFSQDKTARKEARQKIFEKIFDQADDLKGIAGLYTATPAQLEQIWKGILFNGGVEACEGVSLVHDSIQITVAHIGVSLISYQGNRGTWRQELYHRDLRAKGLKPYEEALALIERRRKPTATDATDPREAMSNLMQRSIREYGERAILADEATAMWRMGRGHPVPYELLTGGGLVVPMKEPNGETKNVMPLLERSLILWEKLLLQNRRWLFVPSELTDRALLTIGQALNPLEYAIIDTATNDLMRIADGHLPGGSNKNGLKARTKKFIEEMLGPNIVMGLFRAAPLAETHIFYAHRDFVHQAALIALADSVLQEHRGFPLLLDLARMVCRASFSLEDFTALMQQARFDTNGPFSQHDGDAGLH